METDEQTAFSESLRSEAKDFFPSDELLHMNMSPMKTPRRASLAISTASTQPISDNDSHVSSDMDFADDSCSSDWVHYISSAASSVYDDSDDCTYSEKMDTFDAETLPVSRMSAQADAFSSLEGFLSSHSKRSSDRSSSGSVRSSEWSSDDDDYDSENSEYDDLMASMPIALGRTGGPTPSKRTPAVPMTTESNMPSEGLDLSMLASLRGELQKVGDIITKNKQGEQFLRRAHILASINMLASNVPTCVVDHLGQEIRDYLETQEDLAGNNGNKEGVHMELDEAPVLIGDMGDASSEASELSCDMDDVLDDDCFQKELTPGLHQTETAVLIPKSTQAMDISVSSTEDEENAASSGILDKFLAKPTFRPPNTTETKSFMSRSLWTEESEELIGALPSASYFRGSLLFVDISGFTKLSTVLDPEILSKVINAYFQKIVDIVDRFSGDIQKFAGDALFAEWRATKGTTLEACVAAAASCASAMVKECADFPVLSVVSSKEVVSLGATTLNVHCGLGVGEMTGIHVGDSKHRREYLYIGDAIDQATTACDRAKLGEAVASSEFYKIVRQIGTNTDCESVSADSASLVIADEKSGGLFDVSSVWCPKTARDARSRGVTDQVDGLPVDALIEYRRLMSLYAHPVVVSNDVAAANDFKTSKTAGSAKERIREEAELRSVYVMFMKMELPVQVTGNPDTDQEAVGLLNEVMNLVTQKLNYYKGHLRQFIVDDKGYVMIITFGLRGSNFPGMVSERALPASLLIQQALHMKLGIDSRIGATFGDVYCGAVGGEKRNEYAVLGPSVNLAARLMCAKNNPGILVDKAVRQLAIKSYCFNALDPIVAKGYKEPVTIFEPLDYINRKWGRIEPNFVGRNQEMKKIVQIADETLSNASAGSKFILVTAQSGMGKTSMLSHALEKIRKKIGRKPKSLMVTTHAVRDSEILLPFSTICVLVRHALAYCSQMKDDHSCATRQSFHSHACESITVHSGISDPSVMSTERLVDFLVDVGTVTGVSRKVIDFSTRLLLDAAKDGRHEKRQPAKRSVAAFFSQILLRCFEETKVAIIAVDDIHRMDELSWTVLRRVLEHGDNVILLGAASVDVSRFRVPAAFIDDLDNIYAPQKRFAEIELDVLTKEEIMLMTMKILGLRRSQIMPELVREVMTQSAGMPQFANEVLESIKERYFTGSTGQAVQDNEEALNEIIIHRIDSLDVAARSVLNIAAVLGFTFTLEGLVSVLQESSDSRQSKASDFLTEATDSLRVALDEGIILVKSGGIAALDDGFSSAYDENDVSTEFQFSQEIWHTTILSLMLDSRQRDIHRKLATALSKSKPDETPTLLHELNIFHHWLASGATEETTKQALIVGEMLKEQPGRLDLCFKVYEDTLDTFGWVKPLHRSESGFSDQVLLWLPADSISNVVHILVALGRAFSKAGRYGDATASYENALRIMQKARFSDDVRDRSVLFPAFIGLSDAIAEGHVQQDLACAYEQAMLQKYLTESRIHGRLIHHIHALYLQMHLYSRLAHYDKAIATHSVLKKLYRPDRHSQGLRNVYGSDSGALSFSLAAYIHMAQGNRKQSLKTCWFVLKDIIPHIESEYDQDFAVVYPLLFVLKEYGHPAEAHQVLDRVLLDKLDGSKGKPPSIDFMFRPLSMLLALSSEVEVGADKLQQVAEWACDPDSLRFDDEANRRLSQFGRCADSIKAEICLKLAERMPQTVQRNVVIAYGTVAAANAVTFNRRNVLKMTLCYAQKLMTMLKDTGRDS